MSEAESPTVVSKYVTSVRSRYLDAYRVARTFNGVGVALKVIGAVLGLLFFVGGTVAASMQPDRGEQLGVLMGGSIFGLGLIAAASTWLTFFVFATVISAFGQLLKASVDSAVNTSPFLADDDRAKVMSL